MFINKMLAHLERIDWVENAAYLGSRPCGAPSDSLEPMSPSGHGKDDLRVQYQTSSAIYIIRPYVLDTSCSEVFFKLVASTTFSFQNTK